MTAKVIPINKDRAQRQGKNDSANIADADYAALIQHFSPYNTDQDVVRSLVYNSPSVLNMYYATFPESVYVVRYDDAVVIKDAHTLRELVVVVYHSGFWYAEYVDSSAA